MGLVLDVDVDVGVDADVGVDVGVEVEVEVEIVGAPSIYLEVGATLNLTCLVHACFLIILFLELVLILILMLMLNVDVHVHVDSEVGEYIKIFIQSWSSISLPLLMVNGSVAGC